MTIQFIPDFKHDKTIKEKINKFNRTYLHVSLNKIRKYLEKLLHGANFLNIRKEIIYLNVEKEAEFKKNLIIIIKKPKITRWTILKFKRVFKILQAVCYWNPIPFEDLHLQFSYPCFHQSIKMNITVRE